MGFLGGSFIFQIQKTLQKWFYDNDMVDDDDDDDDDDDEMNIITISVLLISIYCIHNLMNSSLPIKLYNYLYLFPSLPYPAPFQKKHTNTPYGLFQLRVVASSFSLATPDVYSS